MKIPTPAQDFLIGALFALILVGTLVALVLSELLAAGRL